MSVGHVMISSRPSPQRAKRTTNHIKPLGIQLRFWLTSSAITWTREPSSFTPILQSYSAKPPIDFGQRGVMLR